MLTDDEKSMVESRTVSACLYKQASFALFTRDCGESRDLLHGGGGLDFARSGGKPIFDTSKSIVMTPNGMLLSYSKATLIITNLNRCGEGVVYKYFHPRPP